MISEIIPNKVYYKASSDHPFYIEVSAVKVNDDDTYATKEHPRYAVASTVLKYWCETKDEAIQDQIDYYIERVYKKDMSGKADVYQEFSKNMAGYIKENRPEYFL